ncbi:copper chaperone PCu(A)C [Hyphobacterium sp.]|uniref:copper chaperone PCu(A)C n=1 Tax=Hyphobacterium sp. TaxID=2004662 RepID=UPI003BA94F71
MLPITLAAGLLACSPSSDEMSAEAELAAQIAPQGPVAEQAVEIIVSDLWLRPHLGGRTVTAAYFQAELAEGDADLLLSARIEGAERVELHGHFMDDAGVMQMREVGARLIEDDAPLAFVPGGLHLMVFGLETVSEGQTVEGVLVFQNGGDIPVTFNVQASAPL